MSGSHTHVHRDGTSWTLKPRGFCLRCIVFTLGFPVEHLIWEKMPVFRTVSQMIGL